MRPPNGVFLRLDCGVSCHKYSRQGTPERKLLLYWGRVKSSTPSRSYSQYKHGNSVLGTSWSSWASRSNRNPEWNFSLHQLGRQRCFGFSFFLTCSFWIFLFTFVFTFLESKKWEGKWKSEQSFWEAQSSARKRSRWLQHLVSGTYVKRWEVVTDQFVLTWGKM